MRDTSNAQQRADELATLVESRLPSEQTAADDHDAWPLIAHALLSRMTTTLKHIMQLAPLGRGVDAGILLRSLYEHLVHFAWLAASPGAARIGEWRKDDLRQRLKADADARAHGEALFSDEDREGLERQVEALEGNPLVLVNLAAEADNAWHNKLAVQLRRGTVFSFRGMYAIVYRNYSAGAHPSYRGLNPVVEDIEGPRKRVILEGQPEGNGPYGLATVLYAIALYIAAESLGWPEQAEIEGPFQRHPVPSG